MRTAAVAMPSRASKRTVDIVTIRALRTGQYPTIGVSIPRSIQASTGWSYGDRILMRVSEATGNLILSRIKERGEP